MSIDAQSDIGALQADRDRAWSEANDWRVRHQARVQECIALRAENKQLREALVEAQHSGWVCPCGDSGSGDGAAHRANCKTAS